MCVCEENQRFKATLHENSIDHQVFFDSKRQRIIFADDSWPGSQVRPNKQLSSQEGDTLRGHPRGHNIKRHLRFSIGAKTNEINFQFGLRPGIVS